MNSKHSAWLISLVKLIGYIPVEEEWSQIVNAKNFILLHLAI
jgi:hypothetical protein